MMENRAFEEMALSARQRLKSKNPEKIARNSGSIYDPEHQIITLKSLGQMIQIRVPEYSFLTELEGWHQLVILHYLDLADHTLVAEEQITFGGLKDGLVRGTKYDHTMDHELCSFLKGKSTEQIKELAESCGGKFVESNADLCVRFEFLPFYPLWLKIWLADEEFEASGKLLLSKSADHYLTIEDAVTVGDVFLRKICSA